MKKCDSTEVSLKEATRFLSDYSVLLFGSGATCVRMDRNIRRIADSLDMKVEYSILPRHIHLTVKRKGEQHTTVVTIRELPASFAIIATLSKLSWQMADGRVGFRCAVETLGRIAKTERVYPWLLVVLVSLANACFCGLFAGDLVAMATVFVATFCGFCVKQTLMEKHWDFRLIAFVAAFVSTVIASGDMLFGISATPDVAIGTSVLYLVPGIPFINSFCDLIDRHYLCFFGRLLNALVISFSLSAGLLAGMVLMNVRMF